MLQPHLAVRRRFWILAGVHFLVIGCGAQDARERGLAVHVDTLDDGRVRVVNDGRAWTDADAWTAEEELRLGTLAGDGPDQFGQIAAVTSDPQGRIYVLDYLARGIRVFEPDGSYAHTIGRSGEGPGELMRAAGLNWGPEGNLWVWDPGGRFSIFTTDGEFVDSRPRRVRGVIYPWRGEFDIDGSLIDWGLDYPNLQPGTNRGSDRIVYYPVRFSGDFARGDTLPVLEFDFEMSPEEQRMIFSEGLSPYQDRNGAIWFAHNKTFTLYRRTLEGDTTLETSIHVEPAPVTQEHIDSVAARYAELGRSDDAPTPDRFASTKPMIRRIFGDGAGHIYVLSDQESRPLGTFVDVFRESGRYLGRVDLPAPVNFPYPPPHATESHLYYVTTDEFDVEYVVRVRLNKPGSGPG